MLSRQSSIRTDSNEDRHPPSSVINVSDFEDDEEESSEAELG